MLHGKNCCGILGSLFKKLSLCIHGPKSLSCLGNFQLLFCLFILVRLSKALMVYLILGSFLCPVQPYSLCVRNQQMS